MTVRVVDEIAYAARMNDLLRESMTRTGGAFEPQDWPKTIRFANDNPHLARIVGLYHNDVASPDNLLAYAVCFHHGDHGEYSIAASTRGIDLKIPLGFAPAWELMRWARGNGASWFDFGGVTDGSRHGDDPRGGISDFKRRFSKEVEDVGEEWVFTPRRGRAIAAGLVRVLSGRPFTR